MRYLANHLLSMSRADIDLRYYYNFNDVSSVVYRVFWVLEFRMAIQKPYLLKNSISVAVQTVSEHGRCDHLDQVRIIRETIQGILIRLADIKLEANAEYRFKLFWILEGALFLDAGNIWTFNFDPARAGSQFRFNKFYNDIAVGTGTGFRFDFKFVIGRIDLGMKLRDPLLTDGSKWIIMRRPYSLKNHLNDFTMVFGIGYPF